MLEGGGGRPVEENAPEQRGERAAKQRAVDLAQVDSRVEEASEAALVGFGFGFGSGFGFGGSGFGSEFGFGFGFGFGGSGSGVGCRVRVTWPLRRTKATAVTPTFVAHTWESESEMPLSIWGSWRGNMERTSLCRPEKICSMGSVRLSCSTETEPGR